MNVYLYNNTKRLNSTALPPTAVDTLECALKESTSFLSPVLIIYKTTKPTANYMKFENRYYWITDIISLNNNRWEIHGSVDVLATYRGHILNTTAFVLYDSTANTQIPDPRLATKTDVLTYTSTASMPWSFSSGDGTYLVATTGDNAEYDWALNTYNRNARAGTGVYTIPQNEIQYLGFDGDDVTHAIYAQWAEFSAKMAAARNKIFTVPPAPPFTTEEIIQWLTTVIQGNAMMWLTVFWEPVKIIFVLAQQLIGGGNALQNVKAAYWLPFTLPSGVLTPISKPLALGSFKDSVSGLNRVDDAIITSLWIDVSIPWHYSDWRNYSNTEVMLYIPMIGCINIPTASIKGQNTLQVRISLNTYSGSMACEVRCNGGSLGTYGTNVAMPILIGDSNVGNLNFANTITNAVSQNYAGLITGSLGSLIGMGTSVGGIGGGAGTGLTDSITCICRCHDTSQDPSALIGTIGTPTNQLKKLSTGLGYVQTLKAQLNCSAIGDEPYPTQNEIDSINRLLDSGAYLE